MPKIIKLSEFKKAKVAKEDYYDADIISALHDGWSNGFINDTVVIARTDDGRASIAANRIPKQRVIDLLREVLRNKEDIDEIVE